MEPLYGITETAKRLNCCERQVHRLIKEDPTFPAIKFNGKGSWEVDPVKLNEWLSNQPGGAQIRAAKLEAQRPRRGRPSRQFQGTK